MGKKYLFFFYVFIKVILLYKNVLDKVKIVFLVYFFKLIVDFGMVCRYFLLHLYNVSK